LPAIVGFESGELDYESIPHFDSSRHTRVGGLLELKVQSETRSHHPFHMQGFSFQPVQVLDPARDPVRTFDYNELVDTFDIPSEHNLVF
jgi:FtsP/CotA-like multicopper oxidase with cupredoxin domain